MPRLHGLKVSPGNISDESVLFLASFLRRRRKSGGRDQYLHLQVGEVTLIFTTSDNSRTFAGEPATGYGELSILSLRSKPLHSNLVNSSPFLHLQQAARRHSGLAASYY